MLLRSASRIDILDAIWELRRGFLDETPIWFVELRRRKYSVQGLERCRQMGGVAIACNPSWGQEDVDIGLLGYGPRRVRPLQSRSLQRISGRGLGVPGSREEGNAWPSSANFPLWVVKGWRVWVLSGDYPALAYLRWTIFFFCLVEEEWLT